MATVTVLGASGTITVPFKSAANASLAQQLANQISAAITGGTLFAAPYDSTLFPALPTVVGGASVGQQVSTATPTDVTNPAGYPVVVINNADPVTVTGAPLQVAPYSVIGGEGGLTFYGEGSSLGGSIFVGGGNNLITGSTTGTTAADSTNGGLIGDWTIGTGSGDSSEGNMIRLASGNDTIYVGSNDTIGTGGANALIQVTNTDLTDPTVFLGSGNVTLYGGDLILGQGVATGNDLIVLGQDGNGTVAAGSGNATLVGGGDGDIIFGSTDGARQQLWGSGNETLSGGGTSSDTFFGFSAISSTGNVWMTAADGTGENQFWAGAGNDTIWTGLGADTVFVFQDHTAGASPDHLVFSFGANDTLWVNGYSDATFDTTSSPFGVTLNLSDGSQISQVTFAGVSDPNAINIIKT